MMIESFLLISALLLAPPHGAETAPEPNESQDEKAPVPPEEKGEEAAQPLTYQEVMEGIRNAAFNADVNECVKNWIHPDKISMKFSIQPDGSVRLDSLDPSPPKDVFLCIAGAVSLLHFRATENITPVKFAYALPPQAKLGKETEKAAGPKEPEGKKEFEEAVTVEKYHKFPGGKIAGLGLYGSFAVFGQALSELKTASGREKTVWYGQLTGGVTVFGEYLIVPFLALGGEFSVFFPKTKEIEPDGGSRVECEYCENSFLFSLMARAKFPLRVAQQASLYPIIFLGYGAYMNREKDESARWYHGLGAGAGIGLEDYTPFATPFFEIRYHFLAGWHRSDGGSETGTLLLHSVTLNLGIRFP
jgi:hypothetical protein